MPNCTLRYPLAPPCYFSLIVTPSPRLYSHSTPVYYFCLISQTHFTKSSETEGKIENSTTNCHQIRSNGIKKQPKFQYFIPLVLKLLRILYSFLICKFPKFFQTFIVTQTSHIYTPNHTHIHQYTHVGTHAYTHTHTHSFDCTHTCTHTHKNVQAHTQVQVLMHKHTSTHTQTRRHKMTHTLTCIHASTQLLTMHLRFDTNTHTHRHVICFDHWFCVKVGVCFNENAFILQESNLLPLKQNITISHCYILTTNASISTLAFPTNKINVIYLVSRISKNISLHLSPEQGQIKKKTFIDTSMHVLSQTEGSSGVCYHCRWPHLRRIVADIPQ